MATAAISTDGGTTWTTITGDAWPTTTGKPITVRLACAAGTIGDHLLLRLTSSDADTWWIRAVRVRGRMIEQEAAAP